MNYERSCGAVVFARLPEGIRYVLVKSLGGEYGFPKGHMESGETEAQTALREIYEETGLKPVILEGFRESSEYMLPNKENVRKQVIFFLAEFEKQKITCQREELMDAGLFRYEEAMKLLNHENNRKVLLTAHQFLQG